MVAVSSRADGTSEIGDAPIGVFDSGVGGLTVARALLDQLPNEPVLYVGDNARGPYGPRPLAQGMAETGAVTAAARKARRPSRAARAHIPPES